MDTFDWIAAGTVTTSLIYVSFVLTLRDWLIALRRGEAVTLFPGRGGRPGGLWAQVGIMAAALVFAIPFFYYLWIPFVSLPPAVGRSLALTGLVVYLLGLGTVLWARQVLGRFWGISTSRDVKLLSDHELIQTGPYAWVRHPMYFGWWVCMLGLTMLYPVWAMLLMFAFSLLSFSGRARREELALASRFGDAWTVYRSRTKFLIPYIY